MSVTVAPSETADLRRLLIKEGRKILKEIEAKELSLRLIARRVGVSEAAPAYHFGNKEGLLAAIAADGFSELVAVREKVTASGAGKAEKVRMMLLTYIDFSRRNAGLFQLMYGPRILNKFKFKELRERSATSFRLFTAAVADLSRDHGWPAEMVGLLAHSAWTVEHGIATLLLAKQIPRKDQPIDTDQLIHFSIDLFLTGVMAGPANRPKH
jgi:AcrR family transcriptional regulator